MPIEGFPSSSASKESACRAGDPGSIPGSGRSPGEGNSYPLQYSGLENPMDCVVHGAAKSQTRLSDLGFPAGFPGGSDSKESTCKAGDLSSIPGLGQSLGGGHGSPLQYSCLENPQGQGSLAGCSPWGHRESDMTKHTACIEDYHAIVTFFICFLITPKT